MTFKKSILLACMAGSMLPAYGAEQNIEDIRKELAELKSLYQQKIQSLEDRLQVTEEQTETVVEQTDNLAIALSQQSNRTAPNTYNPGIGVILNGKYLNRSSDNEAFSLPGFFLAEEPGPGDSGLALGESELNLSANIDDKFYGSITLAFGEETEVEEAYLKTIALPYGLGVKLGRFFSDVGYLNSHHAHADDFAFRPLAYQAFLGNNFGDDGIQLSWLAPTELYWETGIELYRGDSFPAGGAAKHGKGVKTLFSHIGGDINISQSWRFGISWLNADVTERVNEDTLESFTGDSELWLADFIWKWAPNGNSKITNAKIQGEYFTRSEQGEFSDVDQQVQRVTSDQSGWYVQGVYQFMPQWRVGLRYETLNADDLPPAFADSLLDNINHSPKQLSVMLDWSNSEFSRFRLQYSKDDASPESSNLIVLQYIAAFGAHGAHSF